MKKIYFISTLTLMLVVLNTTAQFLEAERTIFSTQDSILFNYQGSNYNPLDWIGILPEDLVPGTFPHDPFVWKYIPSNAGSIYLPAPADTGTYKTYLFCCDEYEVIASGPLIKIVDSVVISSVALYSNNLTVFPNPSDGWITLKTSDAIRLMEIKVYSISGKLVYQKELDENISEKKVNLSSLYNGVYFLEVFTGTEKMRTKLVIRQSHKR